MHQVIGGLALLLALPGSAQASGESDAGDSFLVGGSSVDTCGWPTTVFTGGCTGTLIHEKAISTAQHCGVPRRVGFGERADRIAQTVDVLGCVGRGSQDAMICELAEPITDLPVTPVLFGCELDDYLVEQQPVVLVGFGQTSFGQGGGTKLWGDQILTRIESRRVIVGNPGDPVSPCPGDSGGPAFVQLEDGSWRVIGTVLGGTTGTPCNSAADFNRLDTVVANFEAERGLDITPCFDAQTGAWEPTEDCGGFFTGDHNGRGSWDSWCEGTPASGYSDSCGPAYGEDVEDTDVEDTDGDDTDVLDTDGGYSDTDDGESVGGCACSSATQPAAAWWLFGAPALLLLRRTTRR